MDNLDPVAANVLMKAVDFLFGEAKALMEERRQARKERGKDEATPEKQTGTAYTTKEEVEAWQPKSIYLKDFPNEMKHCIAQIEKYRSNKRQIEIRISHLGGAMQAPVSLINDLEAQEESIKEYAQRLKRLFEDVYGHKITIIGLE